MKQTDRSAEAMIIREETFVDWMKKQFNKDTLYDIANNGCNGGFCGLTYYQDTLALYDKFHDEIWEMLEKSYLDYGYKNALEMIASFGGAANVSNDEQFKNLLVWYAAENIARQLTETE